MGAGFLFCLNKKHMALGQTGRPAVRPLGVCIRGFISCRVLFLSLWDCFIFFDHFHLFPRPSLLFGQLVITKTCQLDSENLAYIFFLCKVKEASELHSKHSFASMLVERRSDLSQVSQRSYQ